MADTAFVRVVRVLGRHSWPDAGRRRRPWTAVHRETTGGGTGGLHARQEHRQHQGSGGARARHAGGAARSAACRHGTRAVRERRPAARHSHCRFQGGQSRPRSGEHAHVSRNDRCARTARRRRPDRRATADPRPLAPDVGHLHVRADSAGVHREDRRDGVRRTQGVETRHALPRRRFVPSSMSTANTRSTRSSTGSRHARSAPVSPRQPTWT